MSRPIALLTDFGYADAYAGVVRGTILARNPDARIFDLSHGVPQFNVLAGALQLASAVDFWPADTVFLAVVDPGVGGCRRGLVIRSGGRVFVGPDNGLLWLAAERCGDPRAFQLDQPRFWLPDVGATFHARDVFGPVTALLAMGRAAEDFGTAISDAVRISVPPPSPGDGGGVRGEVLFSDHYGNAITNLRPEDMGTAADAALVFIAADRRIPGPGDHYGAVPEGEPVVVLGSLGYYEIAVNAGSAAASLGLTAGSPVVVTRAA